MALKYEKLKPSVALRNWQMEQSIKTHQRLTNPDCVRFLNDEGVGVTLATYSAWKGGHRQPAAKTWAKVLCVLNNKKGKEQNGYDEENVSSVGGD